MTSRFDQDMVAIAQVVAGILDIHIDCGSGSDQCEGCCPECCAPCAGLLYMRDNMNVLLTAGLQKWSEEMRRECIERFPDDDWTGPLYRHQWELPAGGVDWAKVEAHWKPEECHGDRVWPGLEEDEEASR